MFNVVLVQPEIPPNTGNIARLCLAANSTLHLVKPLGFSIDDKHLRRAGMDYWEEVDVRLWENLEELMAAHSAARFWFFTTKTQRAFWDASFHPGDFLTFGRETKGLPESLLDTYPDQTVTIPMAPNARSLNLSTSAGIGLFEAMRQNRAVMS